MRTVLSIIACILIVLSCASIEPRSADSVTPACFSIHGPMSDDVVAIYKYKVAPGMHEEWVRIIDVGFDTASKSAKADSTLKIAFMRTNGIDEGYSIKNAEFKSYQQKRISRNQYVDKIKKIIMN